MEHKRRVYKSTCQERIDTGKAFGKLVQDKEVSADFVLRALKALVDNGDGVAEDNDGCFRFSVCDLKINRNNELYVDND